MAYSSVGHSDPLAATRAVPAYFSDAANWAKLKAQAGGIGLVVFNPDTGPGLSKDPAWVDRLNSLNGTRLVGYVDISYGARDTATVLAEIDKYRTWYGTSSVFVDQVTWNCDTVPILQAIVQKVHSNGGMVVLNPGTLPQACILSLGDVIVSFEGSAAQYKASIAANPAGFAPSRFWHLIYGSAPSEHRALEELARTRGAGYVYVSSDPMPNPWARVESFPATPISAPSTAPVPAAASEPLTTTSVVLQTTATYASPVLVKAAGSVAAPNTLNGSAANPLDTAESGATQVPPTAPQQSPLAAGGSSDQSSKVVEVKVVVPTTPASSTANRPTDTLPPPTSSEIDLFAAPVFSGSGTPSAAPSKQSLSGTAGPAPAPNGLVPVNQEPASTPGVATSSDTQGAGGTLASPTRSQSIVTLGPKSPVPPIPGPTQIMISGNAPDRLALVSGSKPLAPSKSAASSGASTVATRLVTKSTTTTRPKSKLKVAKKPAVGTKRA